MRTDTSFPRYKRPAPRESGALLKHIDDAFLAYVLVLVWALMTRSIRYTDALGDYEITGYGTLAGLLVLGVASYIGLNLRFLSKGSWLVRLTLLWILWIIVNAVALEFFDLTLRSWLNEVFKRLLWPCVLLFFYIYTVKRSQSEASLKVYFICLGAYCAVVFFQIVGFHQQATPQRQVVLNAVYYPYLALPWILLLRNTHLRLIGVVALSVVVFWSFKRTALIGLAASLTCFVLADGWISQTAWSKVRSIFYIACLAIGAAVFLALDESRGGQFTERIGRMSEDEGSGRLDIYKTTWRAQLDAPADAWILGHGHNAVVSVAGTSAHNDWLEVLYDYGLVGFALYVGLHIVILRRAWALFRNRSSYAPAYAACYVSFAMMSAVSHLIIYPNYIMFISAFLGHIEGKRSIPRERVESQLYARICGWKER